MSATPSVLGVDGGGTSTVAWLAEPGGAVLGRGRAGPSNAKVVGNAAAREALEAAIAAAFADSGRPVAPADVACLGLAGFDRPEDREVLARWSDESAWARRLLAANDGDLVVAAGTPEGFGVGVIAGTGSIAVGRSPDGRAARAGGWGPLIGDEGSAYAVALAALRLVARVADGRDPPSGGADLLTDRLCRALGIDGPSFLIAALHAPGVDRARIAALAPVVLDSAGPGSEVEEAILRPAGAALAEMVTAVARSLGWAGGPLPLAMAGSFLLGASVVSRSLLDSLEAGGYLVAPTAVPEPVRGALVLAERALARETGP